MSHVDNPETYLGLGNIPDGGAVFKCNGKLLTISTARLETDIRGTDDIRKLRDFLDQFLPEPNEQIAKQAESLLDRTQNDERFEIISKYCPGCGTKDRSCRCWDDS